MLNLTRISSAPDVGRIGEALARPGMDPRVWTCLAIVTAVKVDPNEGVFLDVTLMPDETQETARLAQPYAGPNFGSHYPVQVDDEVLVFAPNGAPDEGLVVLPRLYSPSDLLPSEVVDNPEDVLVARAKGGQTIRLAVEGGGNIILNLNGSGQVRLGSENPTQSVIKGNQYTSAESTFLSAIQAYSAAVLTAFGSAGLPPAALATITTATTVFTLAAVQFSASLPGTLSDRSKTE
jgi:hypothetical protein